MALIRALREHKNEPLKLEQILGKYFLVEIINIIEVVSQKSYHLCYCFKYSGCSQYEYYVPHSVFGNQYFCCESCQLWTDYCGFFLNNSVTKDARCMYKIAADIFQRKNKIIKNINVASQLLKVKVKYTFFVDWFIQEDHKSLADLVDAHELFN